MAVRPLPQRLRVGLVLVMDEMAAFRICKTVKGTVASAPGECFRTWRTTNVFQDDEILRGELHEGRDGLRCTSMDPQLTITSRADIFWPSASPTLPMHS